MNRATLLAKAVVSLVFGSTASAQTLDEFFLGAMCQAIKPPLVPQECLTDSVIIHDPPAEFIVNTESLVEQPINVNNIQATCEPAIPCDYTKPSANWSYSETTSKSYSITAGLSLSAEAAFAVLLLGKVSIEASFYISGQLSRTDAVTETISVTAVQEDCVDQLMTVFRTTAQVSGTYRQPAVSVLWSTDPECAINPPVVKTDCFVSEYSGSAEKTAGYRLETNLEPCCASPGCCGRLCDD